MKRSDSTPMAFVADRTWTGETDTAEAGLAVLVEGSRITGIAPVGSLPPGIEKTMLPGCTLLPGLIDSHVHYLESAGPSFLAAGVTTVRDTGNDLDWILAQRDRNAADVAQGPRIVCCGRLLDGKDGIWKHVVKRHDSTESLRTSIRENVSRGVDQIKLYASIDEPLLRAGVDEAHRLGKFVLAHLNSVSAEFAAEAGLNEIEHFSRCDVAWREATVEEDDQLIDKFLKAGVVMNPTVVVWDRLGRALEHTFLCDERRRWVHPDLLGIWERVPYRRCEPANRLRFQKIVPNIKRFFLQCHRRGLVIAAGTDTPFINIIPGFSLHDELAQYIDTGLRPVDALRSATATNANVIGLGDQIGRIRPGMDADLLAVRGNPLERIDDIGNVERVVRRGRILAPEVLWQALRGTFGRPMDDPMIHDLRDYVAGSMPTYSQKAAD